MCDIPGDEVRLCGTEASAQLCLLSAHRPGQTYYLTIEFVE